jgi:hypothetical protein
VAVAIVAVFGQRRILDDRLTRLPLRAGLIQGGAAGRQMSRRAAASSPVFRLTVRKSARAPARDLAGVGGAVLLWTDPETGAGLAVSAAFRCWSAIWERTRSAAEDLQRRIMIDATGRPGSARVHLPFGEMCR